MVDLLYWGTSFADEFERHCDITGMMGIGVTIPTWSYFRLVTYYDLLIVTNYSLYIYICKHINNYKFHHCNLSMNLPRCRNLSNEAYERSQSTWAKEYADPWMLLASLGIFIWVGGQRPGIMLGKTAKSLINSLKPGNFPAILAILAFRTSSKWVMTCYDHSYSIHVEILLK